MKSQFVARIKRRSKIGIAFFGILRFGHAAYPILKENIIDPAVSLPSGDYQPFFLFEGELDSLWIIEDSFHLGKIF